MPFRRPFLLPLILVCLPIVARAAPSAAEAEQLRIVHLMADQLRGRIEQLPVVVPAEQPVGDVKESHVTLNRTPVIIEGQRFDGVVIHAPATPASFAWAFAGPPNLASWYILREEGEMKGFTDFLRRSRQQVPGSEGLEPLGVTVVTHQKLDSKHLVPEQRYVLWFRFKDEQPAEFTVRAGFFAAASLNNNRLPDLLFPSPK